MTNEEHETTISYDYADRVVRVYTTREGVRNQILKRLGDQEGVSFVETLRSWSFTIPMQYCRSADMVVKLLNEDEKQPMSEEQKAALRAVS